MSNPKPQSYNNHAKFHPLYHFVLAPLTLILFIAAIVSMFQEDFEFNSILLAVLSLCAVLLTALSRIYATKLQDRIIRNEEAVRHIQLTGKPLDPRLSLRQIIALRFASDAEYPALCEKAAQTGMSSQSIKQSIKNWRADHHRV
ncbi:DUF6526 family protein [Paenibacillus sp. KN14-4R]|uniref:DUF6526 family protein n=1 Tax=Paenibacillus sp. KN14-4R TaxID=3445773 RepID=UPI003FA169A5